MKVEADINQAEALHKLEVTFFLLLCTVDSRFSVYLFNDVVYDRTGGPVRSGPAKSGPARTGPDRTFRCRTGPHFSVSFLLRACTFSRARAHTELTPS